MPWDERFSLGVADMDATHREFVAMADALLVASDEAFPALFAELHEHTRRHFEHEGKLMKACRFPAIGEHVPQVQHEGARPDGWVCYLFELWLQQVRVS